MRASAAFEIALIKVWSWEFALVKMTDAVVGCIAFCAVSIAAALTLPKDSICFSSAVFRSNSLSDQK